MARVEIRRGWSWLTAFHRPARCSAWRPILAIPKPSLPHRHRRVGRRARSHPKPRFRSAVTQPRHECPAMLSVAVAARGDVVGQHREVIRDDQVVIFIPPGPVRHRCPGYGHEVCLSSETSGRVVARIERRRRTWDRPPQSRPPTVLRFRVGLRHQIVSRAGRPHERGNPLEMRGCLTPPRDRREALEEKRRPFGDPFRLERPVSVGRMALPTRFETKKMAPIGALGRIRHLNVAEGLGLQSNLLRSKSLLLNVYESRPVQHGSQIGRGCFDAIYP